MSPGNCGVFLAPERSDYLKDSGFSQLSKMSPFLRTLVSLKLTDLLAKTKSYALKLSTQ